MNLKVTEIRPQSQPPQFALKEITSANFEAKAIEIFNYQAKAVPVYRSFIEALKIDISTVRKIEDIPFLPISFFKTHKVFPENETGETVFTSSSTSGTGESKHFVKSLELYEESFLQAFKLFYGEPCDYVFLALLPSYLERKGSSLVYMAEKLISLSSESQSGFFLHDLQAVRDTILNLKEKKIILLGVTYALLDLAEKFPFTYSDLIIMETGGMKGRRREMIREDVHGLLKKSFCVESVHSEYGMTELLSQAYSKGSGIFNCPPWMKVYARDSYDPLSYIEPGKTGALNVVDLANLHSCSFIATDDLGKVFRDGSFEVLGRFDHSDVRGCNLMYSQ